MNRYLTMLRSALLELIKDLKLRFVLMPPPPYLVEGIRQQIAGYDKMLVGTDLMLHGGTSETLLAGIDMVVAGIDMHIATASSDEGLEPLWASRASTLELKSRIQAADQVLEEHELLEVDLGATLAIPKDQLN